MLDVKDELRRLSDEVWERTRNRLEGLTDAEYFWEPAPGCWSVRERETGSWRADSVAPEPDPAPLTTIAWRLWHLIDMYGEDRAPRWLDVAAQGPPIGPDDPTSSPPSTAGAALSMLDRAHDRWNAHLALTSNQSLAMPIGEIGGDYADRTRAAYVLHMLDEFIHHGAEISLLRDLWRWQHPLDDEALSERARRGDLSLVDEIDRLDDATASELMRTAASFARWDLVTGLAVGGVPIPATGRTPLHLAAGAGELDVVETLVAHGADTHAEDPDFHAPAAVWAAYFDRGDVAAWLTEHDAR